MTSQTIPLGPPVKLELHHCGLEHDAGSFLDHETGRPSPLALAPGHRPILDAVEGLVPGEAIRVNVDHDPEPLLELMETIAPARYGWEPMLEGPDRWVGLIRRRSPGLRPAARRLSAGLARRAVAVDARKRLEREIRAIALDLLGPTDAAGLSPECAAWLSAATDATVGAVRDGSLSVLIGALDRLLASAPRSVVSELDEARDRRDLGLH